MDERNRIDAILSLFKTLQHNWVKKNRFEYVIVPSDDVRGKSLEEMRGLSFRVGVTEADGVNIGLNDLVALLLLIEDQAAQMRKAAAQKREGSAEMRISTVVNLAPSDEEIAKVLSSIQFTIKVEKENLVGPNENGGVVDDFVLTHERVEYVLALVKKKVDVALAGKDGNHFRVYPPQEFIANPTVLNDPSVYEKLKDSVWWVRWYDEQYDQLRFIEFLVFIQQVISARSAVQAAANAAAKHSSAHRASKHSGGWQPKKDRSRKPKKQQDETIRVEVKGGGFAPAELVKDESIRVLLSKVTLEKSARPNQAMN